MGNRSRPKFTLRRLLRWFVLLVIIVVIGVFCSVGSLILMVVYYPVLGRINNFQEIKPGIPIAGTNYSIEETNSTIEQAGMDVMLKNNVSQRTAYITTIANPYVPAPRYTLLSHKQNLYFIMMDDNEGSAGGWDFEVYNITNDEPHDLAGFDLGLGFSCTYPRLDGDSLEFEIVDHCDLFPIMLKPITYRYIQLK
jgi:hypothetical protein